MSSTKSVSNNCWVCGCLLADAGGEPSSIRESHHIVPQAYGGQDGPRVELCLAHHDLVHLIATKLISGKNPAELFPKSGEEASQLSYLAQVIFDADKKFSKDPMKRVSFSVSLSRHDMNKFDSLVKFSGSKNRATYIKTLIAKEHQRIFPNSGNKK